MNRRQFLRNTLYSSLALSFSACGKGKMAESMNMGEHSSHAASTAGTLPASSQGFDLKRLIRGQALQVPQNFLQDLHATLNITPVRKVLTTDGQNTELWQYVSPNGGTLLDVMQGQTVRITVNNQLPEPTTVHWHGLDIPVDQDGLPHQPILPQQSHSYEFSPPKAGTYWFHPQSAPTHCDSSGARFGRAFGGAQPE